MGMLICIEMFALSVVLAWLMFVLAYLFGPDLDIFTFARDYATQLSNLSKFHFWAAIAAGTAALCSLVGLLQPGLRRGAVLFGAGLLAATMAVSAVSLSLLLFSL